MSGRCTTVYLSNFFSSRIKKYRNRDKKTGIIPRQCPSRKYNLHGSNELRLYSDFLVSDQPISLSSHCQTRRETLLHPFLSRRFRATYTATKTSTTITNERSGRYTL